MVNLPDEFHFKTRYAEGPFRAIKSNFGYIVKNTPLKGANEFPVEIVKNLLEEGAWIMVKEIPTKNMNFTDKPEWETIEPLEDIINKPSHYHKGGIDVIGFAEQKFSKEELRGFYRINAIKYITRYEMKGGIADLDKAIFYINKLKELEVA